jgi:hypothetical protein
MTKAMTAMAVVLLIGAAAPALAAPGDQDRPEQADRNEGGRTDHDRVQRDGDAGRPRGDWSQRNGGQRDGGGGRDWSRRDAPDRTAPPAPSAPQAPQPAQTVERRGWDRGDRGAGYQGRQTTDPRADRRTDGVRTDAGRTGDRRDGDRRDWDHRDDHRGDGDRRDWDRRDGDHRDGDRRDWDRRGDNDHRDWSRRDDDRRRWDRHDWNHDWPHWERGRYPTVYFSHSRYHHTWRRPPGFYVRFWSFGDFLPRGWYGPDYWIIDPWAYDLPLPPPGFDWVRVGDDALLVDQFTGRVVQVVRDIFW